MRTVGRYIITHWLWIVIGCILTKLAVDSAYIQRGYIAIGGEYLVLPILLIIVDTAEEMKHKIMTIFVEVNEDE